MAFLSGFIGGILPTTPAARQKQHVQHCAAQRPRMAVSSGGAGGSGRASSRGDTSSGDTSSGNSASSSIRSDLPELRLGKVRAPRIDRGGSKQSRGRVRAQGKGYRTVDYAPPPPGLRVAAGKARGRKLASPQVHLRPMMGKVREALYSMLYMMDAIPEDGTALDMFAGSGSVGIEALSRGMKAAVFVDAADDCVNTIRTNLETCGFGDQGTAVCARVDAFLASSPTAFNGGRHYDLITVTPPYEEVDYGVLMTSIAASDVVGEGTFVVVEYPVELKTLPPAIGGRLVGLRNRRYGRTVLAVYACQPHLDLDPRPDEFISVK
jgi:16S rRNA (guanine966-N2)-methyltransferase